MPITDLEGFNHLCWLSGITDSYYDIRGQHHVARFEAKQSLLASMRINVENDRDVQAQLEQIDLHDWQTIIPPVLVYQESEKSQPISLTLNPAQISQPVYWRLIEENGKTHSGEWCFETHQAVDQRDLNNVHLFRFEAQLPEVSTIGYHQFRVKLTDASTAETSLIVTPETCFQPAEFDAGTKLWGVGVQLYTLRSKRNWGIGDFTDLKNVIDILSPLGVDVIGLNPLHTLFMHLPENASPYSPSSRDFLNPIYLDIESVDEFNRSDKARNLLFSKDFQDKLQSLRDADLVQYTEVWSVKSILLKMLYQQFRQDILNDELASVNQFRQFQNNQGEALFKFALFEALQAGFFEQDATIKNWQQWPEEFRDPDSQSVSDWADSNIEAIEFHQYLQWRAQQQLSDANQRCKQAGMRIGLYNDLAVGNERFSSQCWSAQSQYALGVSVGAPPDDLNLLGQDWGLPPQIPQQLKDHQYRLYIQTLRANMQHAGALRIDHVMGLMRLYWVPENYRADQGTYVAYPFSDLLGILALESQRNHCLIIGEDMGTVPDEVRHQLWLKRVLSYRILFFEKDWQHGSFKSPQDYPVHALCTSGSHDMPTLKGYWQASDIDIGENLNLYPSDDINQRQRDARGHDRYQIKVALQAEHLIHEDSLHDDSTEFSNELFLAIQRFLARSPSLLMTIQLEDLLAQSSQVNIPGTVDEYPNWRHKIRIDLEDWLELSDIVRISQVINSERKN